MVDMNVEGGEVDVAIRCSTAVRTPTPTIDRIVVATRINRSHIRHISHGPISLSRDMAATIPGVDLNQIIADQHTIILRTIILLLVVRHRVEVDYLQARSTTHMAPVEAVAMDRATEDLVEIMAGTAGTVVAKGVELHQLDEAGMEVTGVTGDKPPMVMVATVAAAAAAHTTTLGVEVGAGIDVDFWQV